MEGPSIIILIEEAKSCIGKMVDEVGGNSKIDQQRLTGKKIIDLKSWGKHFLICFEGFTIRIHFLMFGSYRINEEKEDRDPRLWIRCGDTIMNFYSCAVKIIEEDLDTIYEWDADTMSEKWDEAKAISKLKKKKDMMVCDALLDQDIFAGVGNIIKNEVLFRVRMHPEKLISELKPQETKKLVQETRNYCFDFYKWKKIYELRKHWLIYKKMKCRNCEGALTRRHTGKVKRYSWFCENCQK